jgi:arylsulfatase A-like enzyme
MLEGGIRVPAVLRYPPKVPKGAVRHQAVTLMDWYPTILDLCGIEPPEGVKFDGHSVMPVVKDAAAPSGYDVMHWQWQKTWMVRDGNWKLIVNGSKGLCRPRLDRVHLGNLADEHPETVNHAKEHPEIVKRLRK